MKILSSFKIICESVIIYNNQHLQKNLAKVIMLTKKYIFGGLGIISLFFIKQYFNGQVCTVTRDLSNQIVIITGGNSGIGKQTALELAKRNCSIIIAARDDEKSARVVQYIKQYSKNKNIEFKHLQLGSKKSIQQFAQSVKQKYNKIDILINNAGVALINQRRLTEDGFESNVGINYFGHFYLTYLLWEQLKKSQNLRIINLSSESHNFEPKNKKFKINFEDLNSEKSYDSGLAYSWSKLCNVLFTQQLAARIQKINNNARIVSLNPGNVRTQIYRQLSLVKRLLLLALYPFVFLVTKNSHQGAQTTLYTVLQDKNKLKNGGYYANCKQQTKNKNKECQNIENQKALWQLSEKVLGIKFKVD